MWWDKVLVIVLLLAAVAGIAYSVYRQRHQRCEGGCKDCPLSDSCRKEQNLHNHTDKENI